MHCIYNHLSCSNLFFEIGGVHNFDFELRGSFRHRVWRTFASERRCFKYHKQELIPLRAYSQRALHLYLAKKPVSIPCGTHQLTFEHWSLAKLAHNVNASPKKLLYRPSCVSGRASLSCTAKVHLWGGKSNWEHWVNNLPTLFCCFCLDKASASRNEFVSFKNKFSLS